MTGMRVRERLGGVGADLGPGPGLGLGAGGEDQDQEAGLGLEQREGRDPTRGILVKSQKVGAKIGPGVAPRAETRREVSRRTKTRREAAQSPVQDPDLETKRLIGTKGIRNLKICRTNRIHTSAIIDHLSLIA